MVVNGLVNIVITTIEKRFGMNSFQSGLIAGGYDVASFLCLIPVTYFGGSDRSSKPRWLGLGVIVMGIGSLIFASPHVLYGKYKNTDTNEHTCVAGNATGLQVRSVSSNKALSSANTENMF